MDSWLCRHLPARAAAVGWLALMVVFTAILVTVVVEVVQAPSLTGLAIAAFFAVVFGPALRCQWRLAPAMAHQLRTGR